MYAVCAVAMASVVGISSALFYTNKKVEAVNQQNELIRRQERKKNRDRLRKTAEYQRRKQLLKEKLR